MKKVLIVVGTRPNFIKVTRFKKVAAERGTIDVRIVHTGQHFSANMADVFFEQFGLAPDLFLNIGAGSPTTQMAAIMTGLEQVIADERPDLVMVVGDVNSTLAAALVSNKMGVRI
ncbi:MAG: UDP-N-acetylglucosamine 2-epimerase, partial [Flavobacteriales bacterium]|nr:UDP-N-acetylglucosamine 2-epimerase [Flavobacteriales bacterium]